MTQNLGAALLITAIGMGIVFGAILLLWGMMVILVRVAVDPKERVSEGDIEQIRREDKMNRLRQAAAIAVSLALAENSAGTPQEFPLPATPLITAWQAVMRSNILTKRKPVR